MAEQDDEPLVEDALDAREVLTLVGNLLRVAADLAERGLGSQAPADPASVNAGHQTEVYLSSIADTHLESEDRARLQRIAAEAIEDGAHAYHLVREMALAVDRAAAHRLTDCLPPGPISLDPGNPVVLQRPWPPFDDDHQPLSEPGRLPLRPDETPHVRLCRDAAGAYNVRLDPRYAAALGPVRSARRLAVCRLNERFDELSIDIDEDSSTFFNVRPADGERQVSIARAAYEAAADHDVDVLVLPETSLTADGQAELFEHHAKNSRRLKLLVIGSAHWVRPDGHGWLDSGVERQNRTLSAIGPDHRPHEAHKHRPFATGGLTEALTVQARPRVEVLTMGSWKLAIGVCRDVLSEPLIDVLIDLGVNLLLVPAMSRTLGHFESPAVRLASSNLALVAVANNPAEWPPNSHHPPYSMEPALFAAPYEVGVSVRSVELPTETHGNPGLTILHLRSRTLEWVPV